MDISPSLSDKAFSSRAPNHPCGALGGKGLPFCAPATSSAEPRHLAGNTIQPVKTVGAGASTSLKISFWYSTVEDSLQVSDPTFVSVSLRTSLATAWRDAAPSGPVSMMPFEGAYWRFDQPVSFVQLHLPFVVLGKVCDAMFGRELAHDDLSMPADVRDAHVKRVLCGIKERALTVEPTNLLLDSWALLMSEALLQRLSSHGERHARASYGRMSGRGVARVVDYIEAAIDHDLRLTSLAKVAAMSPYHFARSFRETVGMSPHAYVLARRIARARHLLNSSEGSLADIALACGFSSQAHFTTAFRCGLGVTPESIVAALVHDSCRGTH